MSVSLGLAGSPEDEAARRHTDSGYIVLAVVIVAVVIVVVVVVFLFVLLLFICGYY